MVGLKTQNDLEIALRQNKWLGEILERFEAVALPDSWLVAGCIAQTIWNLGCGQPAEFGLKDVDLVYFDEKDLSFEAEASHERRLRDLFQHLPIKLDVKNEARVHLWYEERFGYAIKPYLSSADAIATFPTTATTTPFDVLPLQAAEISEAEIKRLALDFIDGFFREVQRLAK